MNHDTITVLLVEDNSADARLMTDFLSEKKTPSRLEWVTDGYQALDYVFQQNKFESARRPDVIVLDLGLPRISGYEVLKQIKRDPRYKDIPVIVLSTSSNPVDRVQCMALGADGFYSKPYNLKGYEDLIEQFVKVDFPKLIGRDFGEQRLSG